MYVLVYFGVLHDDESVQLAHENRIVPLPDVRWWQSDAYANPNPNANTDSYANADTNADADAHSYANSDTYANTNADASACTECAEQFGGNSRFINTDQSVVDGQFHQRDGL